MSISAVIPIANLVTANQVLAAAGFGPNNFSIPLYGAQGVTHAVLHAWGPEEFITAVKAIADVVYDEGENSEAPVKPTDPVGRTETVVAEVGAQWGANAPTLPVEGKTTAGTIYAFDRDNNRELWYCIQAFDRKTFRAVPETYPALIRRQRIPGEVTKWIQPLDQFNAYYIKNPFTNEPDQCLHNSKRWAVKTGNAAGLNVQEPGTQNSGWIEVDTASPPSDIQSWKQPEGGHDAYALNAQVTHKGKTWVSTVAANVWEPGVYGWIELI